MVLESVFTNASKFRKFPYDNDVFENICSIPGVPGG